MSERDPVRMVDVSGKDVVHRVATATGRIYLRRETVDAVREGRIRKGDPLTVAEVASIQAVKKTPDLIPLCHNVPIGSVDTSFRLGESYIEAKCRVSAIYRTGVEMEALTGVTVALLNIWDMVKYLEKDSDGQYPDARITDVKVTEKWKER
jgi:cyclic pyranopterin monophosphate synthase